MLLVQTPPKGLLAAPMCTCEVVDGLLTSFQQRYRHPANGNPLGSRLVVVGSTGDTGCQGSKGRHPTPPSFRALLLPSPPQFYDVPLLMLEMYVMGVELRGVAHPGHWKGPVGPFFERFGAVPATARNLSRLMKAREPVLLFPGGAREVNKRKGEEYRCVGDNQRNGWRESPHRVTNLWECQWSTKLDWNAV